MKDDTVLQQIQEGEGKKNNARELGNVHLGFLEFFLAATEDVSEAPSESPGFISKCSGEREREICDQKERGR